MKRFLAILILAGIATLIVYRFVRHREIRAAMTIQKIQAIEGYPVEVELAIAQHFQILKEFTGTVTGSEEAEIISTLGEYVAEVLVSEGQKVTAGDPICRLSYDNPTANYAQVKLLSENARNSLTRIETLFQEGAVPRQSLDDAGLASNLAHERLEAVERLLTLRSPISGIVTDLRVEAGRFASPGLLLAKVISSEGLKVRIDIPAADREALKSGMTAYIDSPGGRLSSHIERIALSADKETRTFVGWVELRGIAERVSLSPGLMVEVKVIILDVPSAMTVPEDAVVHSGQQDWIFIADGDRARRQEIRLGPSDRGTWQVIEGIEPGDRIVTLGSNLLFEGAKLRIVKGA